MGTMIAVLLVSAGLDELPRAPVDPNACPRAEIVVGAEIPEYLQLSPATCNAMVLRRDDVANYEVALKYCRAYTAPAPAPAIPWWQTPGVARTSGVLLGILLTSATFAVYEAVHADP